MYPGQIFCGLVLGDTLHTASPLLAPSGLDSIGVVNSPRAPEIPFLKKLLPFSLSSSSLPPQVPFQSHCWLFWPQICQDFPFLIRSFRLSWTWPAHSEAVLTKPGQMLRGCYFATTSVRGFGGGKADFSSVWSRSQGSFDIFIKDPDDGREMILISTADYRNLSINRILPCKIISA